MHVHAQISLSLSLTLVLSLPLSPCPSLLPSLSLSPSPYLPISLPLSPTPLRSPFHHVPGKKVATMGGGEKGTTAGSPLLSVLNVLSGGVFVAAGFMHLLPEAEEGLENLSAEWQFEV